MVLSSVTPNMKHFMFSDCLHFHSFLAELIQPTSKSCQVYVLHTFPALFAVVEFIFSYENLSPQKSLSTEELTAEMANLEGLMKDLNAITQQEFEC